VSTTPIGVGVLTIAGQAFRVARAELIAFDTGAPHGPPGIREIIFSCAYTRRLPDRRLRKALRKIWAQLESRRRIEGLCPVLVRRTQNSRY
jgi:hypothetical protein